MLYRQHEELYYFTGEEVYGDNIYTPDEYIGERWYFINGTRDYMISDYGRVWSHISQRFIKPKPMDRQGHLGVCLSINGRPRYCYIHRLMAQAFIPNPEKHPIVRHLNDVPYDTDLENLAWGTQKDNHRDCVKNGHYHVVTNAERELGFSKIRIPVLAIDLRTSEKTIFRSQSDAARILRLEQSNVWKVLNKQRKHTRGYYFEYLKDGDADESY
jgi:hypothetical protein